MSITSLVILIVEPNPEMVKPYSYLHRSNQVIRAETISQGNSALKNQKLDLIFLSATISPENCVKFLNNVKKAFPGKLVPIIQVVDFSNRINFIPGTSWGKNIGVTDNFAMYDDFFAVIERVTDRVNN